MERIIVQNLKCGGCANTIEQKLGALLYVKKVVVNKEDSSVTLDLVDPAKMDEVKKVLSRLGYPPENEGNTLSAKAKSFVS